MELGCRAYMSEPQTVRPDNWPTPLEDARAETTRPTLKLVLQDLLAYVREPR